MTETAFQKPCPDVNHSSLEDKLTDGKGGCPAKNGICNLRAYKQILGVNLTVAMLWALPLDRIRVWWDSSELKLFCSSIL